MPNPNTPTAQAPPTGSTLDPSMTTDPSASRSTTRRAPAEGRPRNTKWIRNDHPLTRRFEHTPRYRTRQVNLRFCSIQIENAPKSTLSTRMAESMSLECASGRPRRIRGNPTMPRGRSKNSSMPVTFARVLTDRVSPATASASLAVTETVGPLQRDRRPGNTNLRRLRSGVRSGNRGRRGLISQERRFRRTACGGRGRTVGGGADRGRPRTRRQAGRRGDRRIARACGPRRGAGSFPRLRR